MTVLDKADAWAPPRTVPVVYVTVGTDHHKFDRLVAWVDRWVLAKGPLAPLVMIQHGTSTPPAVASGVDYVSRGDQDQLLAASVVVVCHGGPGTIAAARRAGHLPIVVPRDPAHGEHVDRHQRGFAEVVAREGWAVVVDDEAAFGAALDGALADPESHRLPIRCAAGPGVTRLRQILDELVAPPVEVAYIAGMGRSGSTMLERILGQHPDVVSVGELVFLWDRALRDGERCGCGEPFADCGFWQQVGDRAFGGWHRVDATQVLALRQGVDRNRYIPALTAPRLASGRFRRDLSTLGERWLRPVYSAIREVSGARVVLDSSKHASYAHVLHGTRGIDLRLVHCVRNSHAVAASQQRDRQRPEVVAGVEMMPRLGPVASASWWSTLNAGAESVGWRGAPRTLTRYEDFAAKPREETRRVAQALGLCAEPIEDRFVEDDVVDLRVTHTIAGNPMRFTSGPIRIAADEGWRDELSPRDRRTVGMLTWPMRRRYGYRGSR